MTVAGAWENDYGSRMTLAAEGMRISGTYDSTTGSTGQYLVAGWHSQFEPTAEAGQPVALAISWHSISDGAADASWHWVSTLGGQISIVNGEERLILSHLLVAACSFSGVCEQGIYIDKLTYRRVSPSAVPSASPSQQPKHFSNALTGSWRANNGIGLEASVSTEENNRFGVVRGTLDWDSRRLEVLGFTDIRAEIDHLGHQSVAVTAIDIVRNNAMSLGGWIDYATGALNLQSLVSRTTAADSIYLQTTTRPLQLSRV